MLKHGDDHEETGREAVTANCWAPPCRVKGQLIHLRRRIRVLALRPTAHLRQLSPSSRVKSSFGGRGRRKEGGTAACTSSNTPMLPPSCAPVIAPIYRISRKNFIFRIVPGAMLHTMPACCAHRSVIKPPDPHIPHEAAREQDLRTVPRAPAKTISTFI